MHPTQSSNRLVYLVTFLFIIGLVFLTQRSGKEHAIYVDPVIRVAASDLRSESIVMPAVEASLDGSAQVQASILTSLEGAESLPASEQQSLSQAFSDARHAMRELTPQQQALAEYKGVHFFAQNPHNRFVSSFSRQGVRIESGLLRRDWQASLLLQGADPLEIRQNGTRLEYVSEGVVEWFHNQPQGLQQGFIVEAPMAGAEDGLLRLEIELEGLTAEALAGRASDTFDLQFVTEQGEAVLSYSKLLVWDAVGSELSAEMHATDVGFEILVADASAVYPITIDPLIATLEGSGSPKVSGIAREDIHMGISISLEGDTALLGAYNDDEVASHAGAAYVFTRSAGVWSLEDKLIASDGAQNDYFGYSVSLDGDTALVGAYRDENENGSQAGSAYIFTRSATVWTQQAKLVAGDGAADDKFGYAVSLSGGSALIGALEDDDLGNRSGSAYIFTGAGATWTQQTKLLAPDGAANDYFGRSVSIDSDTALVGADQHDSQGSAYVFFRTGVNWAHQYELNATDGASGDNFGWSVALDGDTALVGAYRSHADGDIIDAGSAYIFTRSGVNWSQQAELIASVPYRFAYVGYSVDLDGDTAILGAENWSDGNSQTGTAYIFTRDNVTWTQKAQLAVSGLYSSDGYGAAVSVDGDTALIGAYGNDFDGSDSGACFSFTRSGSVWTQADRISLGDSGDADAYGHSVSLDQDTAVIGVPEDDDLGSDSGSVYVLVRSGGAWSEEAKLTASDGAPADDFGTAVSLNGDTLFVGSPENDEYGSDAGKVYVFTCSAGVWSQASILTASDANSGAEFGYSISSDGVKVLIGAWEEDSGGRERGAAYVFSGSGSSWTEEGILTGGDPGNYDAFGHSVCLDGDTALIGAYEDDSDSGNGNDTGSAYVFVWDGSNWNQEAKLTANDELDDSEFGYSVVIEGDTALIGAHKHDENRLRDDGKVYVYSRSNGVWSLQTTLNPYNEDTGDNFGASLALDGDTALIGATGVDQDGHNSVGAVYVFTRSGSVWTQQGEISITAESNFEKYGYAVALDGDIALIGAPDRNGLDLDGQIVEDQGSVFIYTLTITDAPELTVRSASGILEDEDTESFGNVATGVSQTQIYFIQNTGTQPLTDLDVVLDGIGATSYLLDIVDEDMLSPGEEISCRITFIPTAVGEVFAAIHIASNASLLSFDLNLSGTGLLNSDSDPASDAWETANGFDPDITDMETLDSDGDGDLDIEEIYQNTNRNNASANYTVAEISADSLTLSARYRGNNNGLLSERYQWSPNMLDWYYDDEIVGDLQVNLYESNRNTRSTYRLYTLNAEVMSGDTETLFMRVQYVPVE